MILQKNEKKINFKKIQNNIDVELERIFDEKEKKKIEVYKNLSKEKKIKFFSFLSSLETEELYLFKNFLESILEFEENWEINKKLSLIYSKIIDNIENLIENKNIEMEKKVLIMNKFYLLYPKNLKKLNLKFFLKILSNFEKKLIFINNEENDKKYFEIINIISSFLIIMEDNKNNFIEQYLDSLFKILKKYIFEEKIFMKLLNHLQGLFFEKKKYFLNLSLFLSNFLNEKFITDSQSFSEKNISLILVFIFYLQKFSIEKIDKNILLSEYEFLKQRITNNYREEELQPLKDYLYPLKIYIDLFYENSTVRLKIKNEILKTILENCEKKIAIEFWMISFLVDKLTEKDLNPLLNIMFAILKKKNGFVRCSIFEVLKNMMIFNREFLFKNYFQEIFNLFLNILNLKKDEVLEKFYYDSFFLFVKCICYSKDNFSEFKKIINLVLGSLVSIIKKNKTNYLLIKKINEIFSIIIIETSINEKLINLLNLFLEFIDESNDFIPYFLPNLLLVIQKIEEKTIIKEKEEILIKIKKLIFKDDLENFQKKISVEKIEKKKEIELIHIKKKNNIDVKKKNDDCKNLMKINILVSLLTKDISLCIVDDIELIFKILENILKNFKNEKNLLEIIDCLNFLIEKKNNFLNNLHFQTLFQFANILINVKIDEKLRLKGFVFFEKLLISFNLTIKEKNTEIITFYKFIFFTIFKKILKERNISIIISKIHFLKNLILISDTQLLVLEEMNDFMLIIEKLINFNINLLTNDSNYKEEYYYNIAEFLFNFIKIHNDISFDLITYLYEKNIEPELLKKNKKNEEKKYFNFLLLVNHLKLQGYFYQFRDYLHLMIIKLITYFSRNQKNEKYILIGNFALGLFVEILDKNIEKIFPLLIDILNRNINYYENEEESDMNFLIKENIYCAFGKVILKGFKYIELKENYIEYLIKFWIDRLPFSYNLKDNLISIRILFEIFEFYKKSSNNEFLDFFLKSFLDVIYECYSNDLIEDDKMRKKIKRKLSQYNIFVSSS